MIRVHLLLPLLLLLLEVSGLPWNGLVYPAQSGSSRFGSSVAIDGTGVIAAIGSPGDGLVSLFDTSTGAGSGYLYCVNSIGGTTTASDLFGTSVSMSYSGLTFAAGAPGATGGQGSVTIYLQMKTPNWRWIGSARFNPCGSAGGSYVACGTTVALSGSGLVLAVSTGPTIVYGVVFFYSRTVENSSAWSLFPSPASNLNFLSIPVQAHDAFGSSISLSSDGLKAVISGPYTTTGGAASAGCFFVYTVVPTTRSFTPVIVSCGSRANGQYGAVVSLSGNGLYLLVGTPAYSPLATLVAQGKVSLYTLNAGGTSLVFVGDVTMGAPYNATKFSYFGGSISQSYDGKASLLGTPGSGMLQTGGVFSCAFDFQTPGGSICTNAYRADGVFGTNQVAFGAAIALAPLAYPAAVISLNGTAVQSSGGSVFLYRPGWPLAGPSLSPSVTPSVLPSVTRSSTATRTISSSRSISSSMTASAVQTLTRTSSASLSGTRSTSKSLTGTSTVAASPSVTPSGTPVASTSPSVAASETVSASVFASLSISRSIYASPDASSSVSASVMSSPSYSPTLTMEVTGTSSVTLTSSLSFSRSVTPTASPTASGSATPSLSHTSSPTVSMSRIGTASNFPSLSTTPTVTAAVTLTPTVTAVVTLSSTASPTFTLSSASSPSLTASPVSRSLTPSVEPTHFWKISPTATPSSNVSSGSAAAGGGGIASSVVLTPDIYLYITIGCGAFLFLVLSCGVGACVYIIRRRRQVRQTVERSLAKGAAANRAVLHLLNDSISAAGGNAQAARESLPFASKDVPLSAPAVLPPLTPSTALFLDVYDSRTLPSSEVEATKQVVSQEICDRLKIEAALQPISVASAAAGALGSAGRTPSSPSSIVTADLFSGGELPLFVSSVMVAAERISRRLNSSSSGEEKKLAFSPTNVSRRKGGAKISSSLPSVAESQKAAAAARGGAATDGGPTTVTGEVELTQIGSRTTVRGGGGGGSGNEPLLSQTNAAAKVSQLDASYMEAVAIEVVEMAAAAIAEMAIAGSGTGKGSDTGRGSGFTTASGVHDQSKTRSDSVHDAASSTTAVAALPPLPHMLTRSKSTLGSTFGLVQTVVGAEKKMLQLQQAKSLRKLAVAGGAGVVGEENFAGEGGSGLRKSKRLLAETMTTLSPQQIRSAISDTLHIGASVAAEVIVQRVGQDDLEILRDAAAAGGGMGLDASAWEEGGGGGGAMRADRGSLSSSQASAADHNALVNLVTSNVFSRSASEDSRLLIWLLSVPPLCAGRGARLGRNRLVSGGKGVGGGNPSPSSASKPAAPILTLLRARDTAESRRLSLSLSSGRVRGDAIVMVDGNGEGASGSARGGKLYTRGQHAAPLSKSGRTSSSAAATETVLASASTLSALQDVRWYAQEADSIYQALTAAETALAAARPGSRRLSSAAVLTNPLYGAAAEGKISGGARRVSGVGITPAFSATTRPQPQQSNTPDADTRQQFPSTTTSYPKDTFVFSLPMGMQKRASLAAPPSSPAPNKALQQQLAPRNPRLLGKGGSVKRVSVAVLPKNALAAAAVGSKEAVHIAVAALSPQNVRKRL